MSCLLRLISSILGIFVFTESKKVTQVALRKAMHFQGIFLLQIERLDARIFGNIWTDCNFYQTQNNANSANQNFNREHFVIADWVSQKMTYTVICFIKDFNWVICIITFRSRNLKIRCLNLSSLRTTLIFSSMNCFLKAFLLFYVH